VKRARERASVSNQVKSSNHRIASHRIAWHLSHLISSHGREAKQRRESVVWGNFVPLSVGPTQTDSRNKADNLSA